VSVGSCTDAIIAVLDAKYHYNFWRPNHGHPQRRIIDGTRRPISRRRGKPIANNA